MVVVTGGPLRIQLWDVDTGQVKDLPVAGQFSPDGRLMAFWDEERRQDRRPILYEVDTDRAEPAPDTADGGGEDFPPPGYHGYHSLSFSPGGTWLAATKSTLSRAGIQGPARTKLWNLRGRRELAELPRVGPSTIFSQDDRYLATDLLKLDDRGWTQEFIVWDLRTLQARSSSKKTPGGAAYRLASLTPDGNGLIVGRYTGPRPFEQETACLEISDGRERWAVKDSLPRALIRDGTWFAFLTPGRAPGQTVVEFRDTNDGHICRRLSLAEHESLRVIAPNGETLVVERECPPESQPFYSLLKPLGLSHLLPQEPNYRLQITDSASGEALGLTPPYSEPFSNSVNYSSDSRLLAVISAHDQGSLLQVWDIPPRKPLLWLLTGGVLLALPFAWLAWRRVRRLRRAAA
jgi:hypothetical protein